MKYKVGDKFVITITKVNNESFPYPYVTNNESNCYCYTENELDRLEKLNMTVEEVWEIANKLFSYYTGQELNEIFGDGWSYEKIMKLSPAEVKNRIEEWEESKNIQNGDVVYTVDDPNTLGIVTRIEEDEIYVLWRDGSTSECHSLLENNLFKKTKQHIDISNILM